MNDATRRVTRWIIDVRGEVPLVEELATAEEVHSFACGHARWSNSTSGPASELEGNDGTVRCEATVSRKDGSDGRRGARSITR
jgi:hypothetical protein